MQVHIIEYREDTSNKPKLCPSERPPELPEIDRFNPMCVPRRAITRNKPPTQAF